MWPLAALLLSACQPGSIAAAEAPCRPVAVRADVRPVTLQNIPALTGRVVDQAELLSPAAEARLTQVSARLAQTTTDQLIVVTLPTLNNVPIEDVGYGIGNSWALGDAGKDNGVLLIVAPSERTVRIEVGHGLEPILTNQRAAEIIDANLVPAFRSGNFEEGIAAGAAAIANSLVAQAATPRIGAC